MAVKKFPIEASHIMMFARAVGDDNQIYFDDDYARSTEPGAIVAPPTFMQASAQFDPDYTLRPAVGGQNWMGSGKNPTGFMPPAPTATGNEDDKKPESGGLHAEQHFEYHRHPNPGDILTATVLKGKTWEKQGKRSGTLKFSESITEYRDQNGELVITARGVGVTTERPIDQ